MVHSSSDVWKRLHYIMTAQEQQYLVQEMEAMALPEGVRRLVPGWGNREARVVFLGHSPSASDDETGRPYSGPAGDILDDLLKAVSLQRSAFYITNLVKVWTWKQSGTQKVNRPPLVREIKAWLPFVEQELKLIQPVAVVALGSTAAQFLLGRDFKITASAGKWHEVPDKSPYLKQASLPEPYPLVMGLAQPSYLIHLAENARDRYASTKSQLIQALTEVRDVLQGKTPVVADSDDALVPF